MALLCVYIADNILFLKLPKAQLSIARILTVTTLVISYYSNLVACIYVTF